MRRFLVASTLLAGVLIAAPALAQDAPASEFTVTGGATGVTDYRFRGISQTDKHIAVQATGTIAHSSGFYLSTWGSSIDDYVAAGADAEVDLIAGYTKTFDGVTVDGGVLYYLYTSAAKGANTDFFEPYASVKYTYGPVTGKVGAAYAPKQHAIAAVHSRDDNLYLYGELSGAIPDTGVSLTGHLGRNFGRSFLTGGLKGYYDWSVTANYTWNHITFGAAYVDTDLKNSEFVTPSGKAAGKGTVVGSIGVSF